ncbi:TPA: hypothetical protein ACFU11_000925 [Neisseria subflava]
MENGNLNTEELEFLRTAARDSFYIHAQVENANHKLETALRVWEKVKEGEREAIRTRKKAFIYYCFGVVWFFLALILFLLW